MRIRVIIMCFLVLLVGCSSHLARGKAAFKSGNYQRSYTELREAAKNGEVEAQYALGYMYYYGNGVNESKRLAEYWISKAAKQGHRPAQQALSLIRSRA